MGNEIKVSVNVIKNNGTVKVETRAIKREPPYVQVGQVVSVIGKDGRGIVDIAKTNTVDLVDTYTITYTDETTSTFNVTNGRIGNDGIGITSILKTSTEGLVDTYTITFTNDTTTTFEVTNGENGTDGKEVVLQVASGYIQWKYDTDINWNNLIAITDLKGDKGDKGDSGDKGDKGDTGNSIELQVADGYIQWREVTTETWNNLIPVSSLKGEQGNGIASIVLFDTQEKTKTYRITFTDTTTFDFDVLDGNDGDSPTITIGENDNWYVNGIDTGHTSRGATGDVGNISDYTEKTTIVDADKFIIEDSEIATPKTKKWLSWSSIKTALNSLFLRLDQSTPQTTVGTFTFPKVISNEFNSIKDVNQETIPTIDVAQNALELQSGAAFTGTDATMSTQFIAVKFTASAAHTMGDFVMRIKESADITNTTATIEGRIYADDGGATSKPTGAALATGQSVRFGTLTTSYQLLSFGTSRTLVSGTAYWLVLRYSAAPTGGNIVLDSNVSSNMGATSTDGTTWTNTNVQLRYSIRGRSFYGGRFISTNNYGVYGTSTNSFGVYGTSTNNHGVYGTSTNNYGVYGTSTNSFGVYGTSTNSIGVSGNSTNGYGGFFSSTNNISVYSISTNNYGVYGLSTNNFGVRGLSTNSYGCFFSSTNSYAGYFTRNTATPTGAVPVVLILQDHASDPNAALRVRNDGTGNIAEFQGDSTTVAYIKKNGGIVTSSSIQIGDDTALPTIANKGAIRYREEANASVLEICMKTSATVFQWIEIQRYTW